MTCSKEVHHTLKLPPSINIANVESKISFTDVEYNPPLKFPCKYLQSSNYNC